MIFINGGCIAGLIYPLKAMPVNKQFCTCSTVQYCAKVLSPSLFLYA